MSEALLEEADALYGLPLGEFTAARDARAKELKGQDAGLAATVKGLRKPSVGAWVVNLLVRRESAQVSQVLEVGVALRAAQESLDGAELRALTKQRRQVTAALTARARTLAADEGHRVTTAVAEQVEATLTAAMVDAVAAEAVRSGLLVATLTATGVEAVDVAAALAVPEALGFTAAPRAAAAPEPPELHVVEDPEAAQAELREAEESATAARERLEEAKATAAGARERVVELEAASLQIQGELDELRRRVADLEARAEENDDLLETAEEELTADNGAVAAAITALREAEARLARLREERT